jgi:hypothetical protein
MYYLGCVMKVEKNASKLGKKTTLLIIISVMFLLTTQSLSSQDEPNNSSAIVSIQTDKTQYEIGDIVNVIVSVPDINNYRLYYEYEGFVQRYMGSYTNFSFAPLGIGIHYLVLRDLVNNELSRQSFEVIGRPEQPINETAQPRLPAIPPELKSIKKFFTQQEDAVFNLSLGQKLNLSQFRNIKQFGTWNLTGEKIVARIRNLEGESQPVLPIIEQLDDGQFKITIPKSRAFRPGGYTLNIEVTADNVTYLEEQKFLWGVLAINTQKSVYLPNETAFIGIAVLDDSGHMVCDANVTLEITSPDGQKIILDTLDNTIKVSEQCNYYGVTNLPDYYTTYPVSSTGNYTLNLTATTRNGQRNLVDSLLVQETVEYDVTREGPTRIYPYEPYSMSFTIKANQDYSGIIREYVPSGFIITPQQDLAITTVNDTKILEWNAVLIAGENYSFSYQFDAPDISPYLFTFGPLEIGEWKETREWMIASDAEVEILYDDCNGAIVNSTLWSETSSTYVYALGGYYYLNASTGEYSIATNDSKTDFTKYTVEASLQRVAGTSRGWIFGIGTGALYGQGFCQTNTGWSPTYGYAVCISNTSTSGLGSKLVKINGTVVSNLSTSTWLPNYNNFYNFTFELNSSGVFFFVNGTRILNSSETNYSQGYIIASTGGGGTNQGRMIINNVWYYEQSTPPTVNINTSLNGTFTSNTNPSINFNFTDSYSSTANCTLYFNNAPYNTTNDINEDTQTILTVNTSLSSANYSVYINCTNTYGDTGKSSTIYIIIDTVAPTVNINTSLNNTVTTDNTPAVDFNFTDSISNLSNCTLFFNTTPYNTTNNITNLTQTTLTANSSITDGNYSVYVNCTDQAGNIGESGVLNIEIDTAAPAITGIINDSITNASARINWTTNEEANGSVSYGTTVALAGGISFDTGLLTQHNITISGLSNITLYYYNITSCDAQGFCNISGPYNFTTASSNYAPTISNITNIADQMPVADNITVVNINFTATDYDGVDNLNDSSATLVVNRSGVTRNGSCTANDINATATTYNCSVALQYYDSAGAWSINVSVKDLADAYANNTENTFNFTELIYIHLSSHVFGFGEFFPDSVDQPASSNPLFIDNLGNVNLTQINITGYDLVNGSFTIGVGNVTVNISDAPGIALQDSINLTIFGANVTADVNGVDANASLYFYISIPNVPPLNFTSTSDWVISAGE